MEPFIGNQARAGHETQRHHWTFTVRLDLPTISLPETMKPSAIESANVFQRKPIMGTGLCLYKELIDL